MITFEKTSDCCGCNACAEKCPLGCIEMKYDEEGFQYPVINEKQCVNCGLCEKVCPINNKKNQKEDFKEFVPEAYAFIHKDDYVREHSSSGGAFSLFAEYILNEEGVVFGAAFSNDYSVKHILISSREDLYKLRYSKYVQSNNNNIFSQVKRNLQEGRQVLFSGTPCQIEGLLCYLGRDYGNLFCIDIICHGVLSPVLWDKYLCYQEKKNNSKIKGVCFRDKRNGWRKTSFVIYFSDAQELVMNTKNNAIERMEYLNDWSLRPSCYDCRFKNINRKADVTIADFWGVENICPELNDDKGISLVLLHSKKGQALYEMLKSNNIYKTESVDFHQAVKCNSMMVESVKYHKYRDGFFGLLKNKPYDVVIKKYSKRSYYTKKVKMALIEFLKQIKVYELIKNLNYKILKE